MNKDDLFKHIRDSLKKEDTTPPDQRIIKAFERVLSDEPPEEEEPWPWGDRQRL